MPEKVDHIVWAAEAIVVFCGTITPVTSMPSQTYLAVSTGSVSGHLIFDEPDNSCKDGTSDTAASDLANERADVDRARGVG